MINNFSSNIAPLARELFDGYESFKMAGISSCRFTHADLLRWLTPIDESGVFQKRLLGTSGEGRPIFLYSFGAGSTKVMLWSQMHGDEPTATMALLDIFKFLKEFPEHTITKSIQEKLTLLAIPMLNPDGAQRFTRRTAQLIDMNRDALMLETPEGRILKETREKHQPEYGFNLHDQDPRLTVGTTKKMSSIALLAPSTDESRADNPVRIKAKKVASTLAQVLSLFIPGYLAKWDDTFEPRAFGDNIQKWGTSTVLVESGGWRGDPDKFFIRKLNCVGLLIALYTIATGETERADIAVYEQIPFNTKLGCDTIIRNARYTASAGIPSLRVDVAINFERHLNTVTGKLEHIAAITDIGDLSTFTALEEEIDACGGELDADRIKLDRVFPAADIPKLFKRT